MRRIELAAGIVAAPNPLLPGSSIFQVELLRGHTTIATGDIYGVSTDGSYSNGQGFSHTVTIGPVIGQ